MPALIQHTHRPAHVNRSQLTQLLSLALQESDFVAELILASLQESQLQGEEEEGEEAATAAAAAAAAAGGVNPVTPPAAASHLQQGSHAAASHGAPAAAMPAAADARRGPTALGSGSGAGGGGGASGGARSQSGSILNRLQRLEAEEAAERVAHAYSRLPQTGRAGVSGGGISSAADVGRPHTFQQAVSGRGSSYQERMTAAAAAAVAAAETGAVGVQPVRGTDSQGQDPEALPGQSAGNTWQSASQPAAAVVVQQQQHHHHQQQQHQHHHHQQQQEHHYQQQQQLRSMAAMELEDSEELPLTPPGDDDDEAGGAQGRAARSIGSAGGFGFL
jgi:hypothetical protein